MRHLEPYVPGEQPKLDNLIKLNTNESPYPPSPRVIAAIQAETDARLRLYPDPESERLRTTIADYHGVQSNQVFVGNGSDEVLAHVFLGLLKHSRPLLFPDITYSFYPVYCRLYEMPFCTVPLDDSLCIRPEDYAQANGGIILPNPNAPTGRALSLDAIAGLLRAHPDSVVCVDEAYIDFGGETAIPLVRDHANLLVVHTLSKARSLAGLRVGFAIGQAALIDGLNRVKNSFNSYPLDRLAQVGAVAAYLDRAYFEQCRQRIVASRAWLVSELSGLGFEVLPSVANFVFARHPGHAGASLAAALRERSIIVRHFKQARIEQFLRITVGDEDQCKALVNALGEILHGRN